MNAKILKIKFLSIPYPENGIVTDGQQPKFDLEYFLNKILIIKLMRLKIARDKNNYPIVKFSFFGKKI